MSLEGCYLFGGVEVVDSNLEIIRAADNPILAGDEAASSHRYIGEFERFDDGLWIINICLKEEALWYLRLERPYVDMT